MEVGNGFYEEPESFDDVWKKMNAPIVKGHYVVRVIRKVYADVEVDIKTDDPREQLEQMEEISGNLSFKAFEPFNLCSLFDDEYKVIEGIDWDGKMIEFKYPKSIY
jgi:hypothetical protein